MRALLKVSEERCLVSYREFIITALVPGPLLFVTPFFVPTPAFYCSGVAKEEVGESHMHGHFRLQSLKLN